MITRKAIILLLIGVLLVGAIGIVYGEVEQGSNGNGDFFLLRYQLPPSIQSYLLTLPNVESIFYKNGVTTIQLKQKKITQDYYNTQLTIEGIDKVRENNLARTSLDFGATMPMCLMDTKLKVPVGYYSNGGNMVSVINDSGCY